MRLNIAANVAGRLWVSLMNFAFVPLYVHFLGIESYGLIGFFVALMSAFMVLDMGLSVTINRELAKYSATSGWHVEGRDLLRTFEILYWIIGAILSGGLILAAPVIAKHWLQPEVLTVEQTTLAIRLMGVAVFFRWPQPLYTGALMGLGRQIVQNGVLIFGATLQGGGVVLVLWLISPSIKAFFLWQIFAVSVQSMLLIITTWRSVPSLGHHPKFSLGALYKLFRFSAGVTGIAFFSVILTQSDKFLLSKLLPLTEFGYYALASAIAGVLSMGAMAVYAAAFPALSQRVAAGDTEGVIGLYRQSSQLLAIMMLPVGISVAMFSTELMAIYTGSAEIASKTHGILSLLAIGNLILSIMVLPLALQLSYGWTKLSIYKNIIAIPIYVPSIIFLTNHFGSTGAALAWVLLSMGYFLFEVPIMHQRLIKQTMWPWYIQDVGVPAVVSIIVLGTGRFLIAPTLQPTWIVVVMIGIITGIAICVSALASPKTRMLILAEVKKRYKLSNAN